MWFRRSLQYFLHVLREKISTDMLAAPATLISKFYFSVFDKIKNFCTQIDSNVCTQCMYITSYDMLNNVVHWPDTYLYSLVYIIQHIFLWCVYNIAMCLFLDTPTSRRHPQLSLCCSASSQARTGIRSCMTAWWVTRDNVALSMSICIVFDLLSVHFLISLHPVF